jgi:alkaline phosphatase
VRRVILLLFALCFFIPFATSLPAARNVILMIADGWGFNQNEAAADWNGYRPVFENFPVQLAMSTYSWSTLQGDSLGYDPRLAWSDFLYLLLRPTDSASAATAMSTGVKSRDGQVALDP